MGDHLPTARKTSRGGLAPYFGGKARLAGRLVEIIESVDHRCYAEPFVGMGGVFFSRTKRAKAEAINDLNYEVANLFRCVERHLDAVVDCMSWRLASTDEFERLKAQDPALLTDIERAVRFAALQHMSFAGLVARRRFRRQTTGRHNFNPTRIGQRFRRFSDRLAGVTIESKPYGEFIDLYDRPHTMFYIDPPYWDRTGEYDAPFANEDLAKLADQLASIEGKFLLSINDVPETREVFRRFVIDVVPVRYSVQPNCRSEPYQELVVRNW